MTWMIFHSQTQAMACRCVLVRKGLRCRLRKPSRRQKEASCAWAVGAEQTQGALLQLLRENNIQPATWRSTLQGEDESTGGDA